MSFVSTPPASATFDSGPLNRLKPITKHNHRLRSTFASVWIPCIAAAAGLLLCSIPCYADNTVASPATTPEQKSLLLQMQDAFTKIADAVEPTVVNIKAERVRPSDTASADNGDEPP